MAANVERPFELGRTLGGSELLTDEEDDLLGQGLGSADAPRNHLARGFVIGRRESRGWPWVEAKLAGVAATWSPEARAEFFGHLHFEGRTWDLLEATDEETRRLYWTGTGPYGLLNAKECRRAVGEYLKYDRPYAAADLLALHIDDEEAANEPSAVADVLERVIGTPPPSEGWIASSFAYHVGELLDFLEDSDEIGEDRMAALEWGMLPLLEHRGRPARTLHRALSRDPGFFAEVLELVFKPEGEEPPELSEEDLARVRLGNDLLDNWQEIPGRDEAGSVDPEALRTWVGRAREEASTRGRGRIGDHLIGKALAFSPKGSDDAWPHEAVRDLLEELESEDVERGMEISVYNSRGVVTRDPTEGGEQERGLVEAYRGHAENLSDRWPLTSALLRRIAEGYDSDARREDLRAELQEDLWG